METDIALLQLRQVGVEVPPEVVSVGQLDADGLYAVLRQVLPLCGRATAATVKRQLPSKLPNASPSARFYVLNTVLQMLNGAAADDSDGADSLGPCPATAEGLMYPAEGPNKALATWLVAAIAAFAERAAKAADDSAAATNAGEASGAYPSLVAAVAQGIACLRGVALPQGKAHTSQSVAPRRRLWCAAHTAAPAPVLPVAAAGPSDAAADVVAQVQRMQKQAAALALATAPDPVAARVLGLHQALAVLQPLPKAVASPPGWVPPTLLPSAAPHATTAHVPAKRTAIAADAFFATDAEGLGLGSGTSKQEAQRLVGEAEQQLTDMVEKAKSAAALLEEREAEQQRLAEALAAAKRSGKDLRVELSEAVEALQALTAELAAAAAEVDAREQAIAARRDALQALREQFSWLEDYDGNVVRMEAEIAEARSLHKQVQEDLFAKLGKMDNKRDELAAAAAEAGDGRQEQLLALRKEVKAAKKALKAKVKEVEELRRENERIPKDIDRSLFLRYIFDMSANVQRQQQEVDKVKAEIHSEAVAIGDRSATLMDLFSAVEQEVYSRAVSKDPKKAAPGEDFAKEAFKSIVAIRESYAGLRTVIQIRGELRHDVHIVEEKSGKAQRLVAAQATEKVVADTAAVQEENNRLDDALSAFLESRQDAPAEEA